MQQIQNNCSIIGHEKNKLSYVCTYKHCIMINRWVCDKCIEEKLHDHQHILDKDQFLSFIEQKSIQKMLQILQTNIEIQKITQELDQIMQESSETSQKENPIIIKTQSEIDFILQLIDKTLHSFYQLSNDQINCYINLDNETIQFHYQKSQEIYEQVKLNYEVMKKQLKEINFKQIKQDIQIVKQQNEKQKSEKLQTFQDVKKIDTDLEEQPLIQSEKNDVFQKVLTIETISSNQISPDEQYLVYQQNKKLQIINLTYDNKFQIDVENTIKISKFSDDSKFLICGDQLGFFFIFNALEGFKQIYCSQLFKVPVIEIIFINQTQVLVGSIKQVILVDITENQQRICIDAQNSDICAVDFDKQNHAIITYHKDNYFQFHKLLNGELIFQQSVSLNVENLQIFKFNNQLITTNRDLLQLWNLDYNQQRLTKIKQINESIFNISLVGSKKLKYLIVIQIQLKQYIMMHKIQPTHLLHSNQIVQIIQLSKEKVTIYQYVDQLHLLKRK